MTDQGNKKQYREQKKNIFTDFANILKKAIMNTSLCQ